MQVGDSDKLGATKKYDRKEVGSKPSTWVTRLVAQIDQFDAKVRTDALKIVASLPSNTPSGNQKRFARTPRAHPGIYYCAAPLPGRFRISPVSAPRPFGVSFERARYYETLPHTTK